MSDAWDSAPLAQSTTAPASAWDSAPLARPSVQQKAVISANDSGDEAAKALAISKKTTIPPTVVQSDIPGYDAHMRWQSAQKAMENPYLAKYIDGNPMAAKVSSDDWDNLDKMSQAVQGLDPEYVKSRANGGLLGGIQEINELLKTDVGKTKLTNALIALPYHLGKGLYDFVTFPGRGYKGEIDLSTEEGLNEALSFGIGVALGGAGPKGTIKVGRVEPTAPAAGTVSFDNFMSTLEGMKTRKEIDDFIASKTPGPPGAVLQIEHAKAGSTALDNAVEAAQTSKTKERAPDLFAEVAQAHNPGDVHIDAGKLMELYQKEGKVPAEGDGLFGFVPDIARRVADAAEVGGEITIPASQYIAHIDPAVHEGLKDVVRLHDAPTMEEAKEIEKQVQKSIEAFHGTPHDFESFDLSKIGTGEGAQSYGHGLYFAENKAVGEEYQRVLATTKINGVTFNPDNPVHKAAALVDEFGKEEALVRALRQKYEQPDTDGFNDRVVKLIEKGELPQLDKSGGGLYKVSINADPTHFLDWDKPLSEQSEHVQNIIKKMGINADASGSEIYEELKIFYADKKVPGYELTGGKIDPVAASKALAEAGIPGIKYLDQGSRRVGDGTRNFVVFDDRLVKIKEKNGEPVAAMLEKAVEISQALMSLGKTDPFLNMLFTKGESLGITENEINKYSDKIANQEQAILDKSVAVGKREAGRRLTPEWKKNEAKVRDEVIAEFRDQGAFAAEKFLRDNKITLGGDNIDTTADQLAPLFGFETGNQMREALVALETEQAASGKSPQRQLPEAIKAETARRMEERHGNLAENIAKEARQIALAEHTFDILADEVRLLAKAAGTTSPLGRNDMVDWAKKSFERGNIVEAGNWEKQRRAVEKNGREAEKSLLKGDFAEAFMWKQRQFLAATIARQSAELQGLIDKTEKKIDRFSSEEQIAGLSQPYLEQLRQVLASVGLPQQFAPLADTPALRDFVADSEGQIAAAPWLLDGSQPKLKDMTVEQFRAFADSLKSIEHVGRQAEKLMSVRGDAELQNVVFDIKKELERFKFIDQPTNPSIVQRANSVGRKVIGAHLLVERMFDYTDKFNPEGPITQYIDRPLRDSNVKELELTERASSMIRDLYSLSDASTLELIPNNIIPDKMAKTGFMNMTRQNLRQLVLNMGNWSNLKKAAEGFGVNEADLRRFVDANATAKDVAWVNGVWKIFDMLKPEADAMQLRDTGVPSDTIPGVPWDIKGGKLNGGYYPIVYDRYNSDIQGHMAGKNPVFDQHYVSATTPHGYTVARTDYKGALDLGGSFLATRVQGMIHDIAFREAIRSANRLISNQEFRTALAQRWGKEYSDLLPGWLKDIANSHTLDDDYAQGMARSMALIRQNVVSTLIAFNPSTFIKHGFTAAFMSAERVGFVDLAKATKELGVVDAWQAAKDLVRRGEAVIPDADYMQAFRDSLDQGGRGDSVRNFVLQSSPVMRARSRQVDDTIRGAIDKMNQLGAVGVFKNLREKNIQYGRFAVAFSDQMSAVPTWYAAYKKAYLDGATHEDAVFQADKEVSRAHGSQFVGDQPLVTRLPNGFVGEVVKLFTPLYKFYNHFANNNFQFVWDANAALHGNPTGEPGANAARLSRHIGVVLMTLFIEEQASAALDKDKKGFLHSLLMRSLHLFGGQFIGLREVTSGLSHGYGPASGLMGTIWKAGEETVKDIGKSAGVKAGLAKNWIRHTADTIGFATGLGGSQLGRTGQFLSNVGRGQERPRNQAEWRQGLRTGSSKARIH